MECIEESQRPLAVQSATHHHPSYRLLGKSGLRVSPFCLGTGGMMGNLWCAPWTLDLNEARQFFNYYLERGGNFIDTADCYHDSEIVIGKLVQELPDRDKVVLATKCGFGMNKGDPNGAGNSRKYIIRALESSLRRLNTEYIDLFWIHNWDNLTPIEETLSALNHLVQTGKIRYIGLSNVPAWYLARAQTIAELRGLEKICAIQMEYSLAMRNIEFEYFPAAIELGIGICAWGPLASGLLTGKYRTNHNGIEGQGRISKGEAIDTHIDPLNEQMKTLVEQLIQIAQQLERTPAQIALNWIHKKPQISSILIGASNLAQLKSNLTASDFELPDNLVQQLDSISQPLLQYPYFFHTGAYLEATHAHTHIIKQPA